jgi:hypothetical protein
MPGADKYVVATTRIGGAQQPQKPCLKRREGFSEQRCFTVLR